MRRLLFLLLTGILFSANEPFEELLSGVEIGEIKQFKRREIIDEEIRYIQANRYVVLGEKLLQESEYEASLSRAENALNIYEYFPKAMSLKARVKLAKGDYNASIGVCLSALDVDNTKADIYLTLASSFEGLGEEKRAFDYLLRGFAINKGNTNGASLIPAIISNMLRNGKQEEARDFLIDALQTEYFHSMPQTHEAAGSFHLTRREYEESYSEYNLALIRYNTLISISSNTENIENTQDDFSLSLAISESSRLTRVCLDVKYEWLIEYAKAAIKAEEYEKALSLSDKAIIIKPQKSEALLIKGEANFRNKNYDISWDYFEQALIMDRGLASPYLYFAQMNLMRGKTNDAIDILRKATQYVYTNKEIYSSLINLSVMEGNIYEPASFFSRNILRFENTSADEYILYSRILMAKGESVLAKAFIKKAQENGYSNTNEIDSLLKEAGEKELIEKAKRYLRLGIKTKALETLTNSVFTENNIYIQTHLAFKTLHEAGLTNEAVSILRNALRKTPLNITINRDIKKILNANIENAVEIENLKKASDSFSEERDTEIRNAVKIYIDSANSEEALSLLDSISNKGILSEEDAYLRSRAIFEEGIKQYLENNLDKARFYFSQSIRVNNRMFDASYFLNEMSYENKESLIQRAFNEGNYDEAFSLYEESFKLNTHRAKLILDMAKTKLKNGQIEEAENYVEIIDKMWVNEPYAKILRGDIYFEKTRYTDALKYYIDAIKMGSDNAYELIQIGRCYMGLYRYKTALKYFGSLLNQNPAASLFYYYAEALYNLKQLDESEKYMSMAVNLDEGNPYYRLNLGVIEFERGKYKESLSSFEKALEMENNIKDGLFYKARTLYYLKRYDEAISILKPLIRENRFNALYRLALGKTYAEKGLSLLSSDIGRYINYAILELDTCISFCRPYKDEHIKREAEIILSKLEPNFHIISKHPLSTPVSGGICRDTKQPALIYVGTENGYVSAVDAIDADIIWETKLDGNLSAKPSQAFGYILCVTETGMFYVLQKKDGKIVYSLRMFETADSPAVPMPEIENGKTVVNKIAVASKDGRLYIIENTAGEFSHYYIQLESSFSVEPVYTNGIFYGATMSGRVYCIEAKTGKTIWSFETGGAILHKPVLEGGFVYIASDNGICYKLNSETGNPVAQYRYKNDGVKEMVIEKSHIFFGDSFGRFHVLSENLESKGYEQVNGSITHAPVFAENYIIFGCEDGRLYLKTTKAGEDIFNLTFDSPIKLRPVVISENLLAIITESGMIHIVAIRTPFSRGDSLFNN